MTFCSRCGCLIGNDHRPPCDHLAVSGARWFAGKGLRYDGNYELHNAKLT